MDKSKMAKADTTVNYKMFKGDDGTPKLSHGLKKNCQCMGECYCDGLCSCFSSNIADSHGNSEDGGKIE